MNKQTLTALSVIIVTVLFPAMAMSYQDGDYYLSDNGDGTCTISGYTGSGGDIAIPSVLTIPPDPPAYPYARTLRVTVLNCAFYDCISLTSVTIPDSVITIGDGTFFNCSSLTSVTIPDSVISIGRLAFYHCDSLTSVAIPDSITSIRGETFQYCSNLASVIIPDSVISIGSVAFQGCSSLTSVTIPDSVTSLGNSAFAGCSSLTSVIIGNSVTSIEGSAFEDCSSLTSVTIPDSVISIGDWAFLSCSGLTSVTIPDSVISIGEEAFAGCSSLTIVTIPDSVTSIGDSAFAGCNSLTSVTIPDSVTSIGAGAFLSCSGLTSVTIPDSVISIGEEAFAGCSSLMAITVDSGNANYSSGNGVLFDKTQTTLIQYPLGKGGAYVIPNSVINIRDFAFMFCSSLTSVIFGNSVTNIGEGAFANCSSLTSVIFGNSVTSIGIMAFCSCSSLASVTIPDSVTSIEDGAFLMCSSLTGIYFRGDSPSLGGLSVFGMISSEATVYYIPTKTGWGPTYGGLSTGILVTTHLDAVVNDDEVSLREAIEAINAYPAGYVGRVKIDPSLVRVVFYLNSPLDITYDLNLQQSDESVRIYLDGGISTRAFEVASGVTVNMYNLAFQNGRAIGDVGLLPCGGAIYNQGTLSLVDCDFAYNAAQSTGSGGAIENYEGDLTLTNCDFTNNWVDVSGGAIHNYNGQLTVIGCEFSYNSAEVNGGAIDSSGTLNISDSTISRNAASGTNCHGGGINATGPATMTDCTISYNTSYGGTSSGGGLVFGSTWDMSGCDVYGNAATKDGGGIWNNSGDGTLTNCNVYSNMTGANGGGIYNDGSVELTSTMVYSNEATGSGSDSFGGGIYSSYSATSTFNTADVYDNSAATYGQNYWPIPRIRVAYDVQDEVHYYDLGTCLVGNTAQVTMTVYDWSVVNLMVTQADGLTAPFSVTPVNESGSSDDWTVLPGSSGQEFTVSFSPSAAGAYNQTLVLQSNDIDTPAYEIIFTGRTSDNLTPSVTGLTFEQAQAQLENNGLVLGDLSLVFDINVSQTTVTGQDPLAGTAISLGSTVDLTVTKSPEIVADGIVDLVDFAVLANRWLNGSCSDSQWCDNADIDLSGDVDIDDLTVLATYWLE